MKITSYGYNTQAVAVNTTQTALLVKEGWNFVNTSATATASLAITFPTAFPTSVVGIQIGVLGARTSSDPVAVTDINVNIGGEQLTASAASATTSGFTAQLTKSTNFTAGTRYAFWWRATGT